MTTITTPAGVTVTHFDAPKLSSGVVWGRGGDQLDDTTETDYILEQQS